MVGAKTVINPVSIARRRANAPKREEKTRASTDDASHELRKDIDASLTPKGFKLKADFQLRQVTNEKLPFLIV